MHVRNVIEFIAYNYNVNVFDINVVLHTSCTCMLTCKCTVHVKGKKQVLCGCRLNGWMDVYVLFMRATLI